MNTVVVSETCTQTKQLSASHTDIGLRSATTVLREHSKNYQNKEIIENCMSIGYKD